MIAFLCEYCAFSSALPEWHHTLGSISGPMLNRQSVIWNSCIHHVSTFHNEQRDGESDGLKLAPDCAIVHEHPYGISEPHFYYVWLIGLEGGCNSELQSKIHIREARHPTSHQYTACPKTRYIRKNKISKLDIIRRGAKLLL